MNDEIQSYLLKIIDDAGSFLASELPEIASQILNYSIFENIIWILISSAVLVAVYFTNIYIKGNYNPPSTYDLRNATVRVLWLVPTSTIFVFVLVFSLLDIVKILIAPKLFLISYAANLGGCH